MPAPALFPNTTPAGASASDFAVGDLAAGLGLAVNSIAGAAVPDWVQLTPPGLAVTGRDGRAWRQTRLDQVVAAFAANRADLPIDFEHATQIKAERGEPAPACGWIKDLEVRGDAGAPSLWARVAWNKAGEEAIASQSYRYVSPVFLFDRATTEIVRIKSAGLTNEPNLPLQALNRARHGDDGPHPVKPAPNLETSMDKDIIAALGLGADATAAQAVVAINKLKDEGATARNRASALEASLATPDSTKWVPKADHDLAINRIKTFEAEAATRADAAITAAVDAAIAAGKVAPASRDYHVAACRQDGGLERFQVMVGSAPAIVGAAETTKPTPGATDVALNAEERAVADQLGISHADFAKAKQDA